MPEADEVNTVYRKTKTANRQQKMQTKTFLLKYFVFNCAAAYQFIASPSQGSPSVIYLGVKQSGITVTF